MNGSDQEDVLLQQALTRVARRVQVQHEAPGKDADPRGRVFPGNMPAPGSAEEPARNARRPGPARRKVSTFSVVLGLLLTAVASVLYISNVIAVDSLAAEIGRMEEDYQALLNEQEMVRAQIARLSGLERIRRIAEQEYGMQYSEAVPGWLTVDPERIEELQRLAGQAGTHTEP